MGFRTAVRRIARTKQAAHHHDTSDDKRENYYTFAAGRLRRGVYRKSLAPPLRRLNRVFVGLDRKDFRRSKPGFETIV
jgi:hypothetical protein